MKLLNTNELLTDNGDHYLIEGDLFSADDLDIADLGKALIVDGDIVSDGRIIAVHDVTAIGSITAAKNIVAIGIVTASEGITATLIVDADGTFVGSK